MQNMPDSVKIQDSYESMFGTQEVKEVDYTMPAILPMSINEGLINETMERAKREGKWVLAFVIGTKPCFYKFYGSIVEAHRAGLPYLVINSNQHYDDILTYGLKEFNFAEQVAVNLSIRGDLAQKSAELIIKISWLARELKKKWPGVTVVPVVLGDTIMTAVVPAAWMFSRNEKAIQNEAGLRSMAPSILHRAMESSPEKFVEEQFRGKWELLRNEPFPEQWDTYTSAAGSQFLFAPVELNRQHLIREGYPEKNIWTIGGVVVDALELKRKEKPQRSIFSHYPALEEGDWIRMDIHRRENLTPRRFRAIIGSIKKLLDSGFRVNFIEMSATRAALDDYGLRKEIEKWQENRNFLFTKVWPEYAHVIEFFESEHCRAVLTDSGGVQEEMNILKKPCLTCRFSTDRPETVMDAHSNVIVPPISSDYLLKTIKYVYSNDALMKSMRSSASIYGENAGRKFIKIIEGVMGEGRRPWEWAHEALGLWKEKDEDFRYL
jgi:UDP-N-acetylglucosamine 2-epimerase